MADQKEMCRTIVATAANEFKSQKNIKGEDVGAERIRVENLPKPELGDIGCPLSTPSPRQPLAQNPRF